MLFSRLALFSAALALALTFAAGEEKATKSDLDARMERSFRKLLDPEAERPVKELISDEIRQLLDFVQEMNVYGYHKPARYIEETRDAVCAGCKAGLSTVLGLFHTGVNIDTIIKTLIKTCQGLGIVSDKQCDGIIHTYAPEVEFIVTHSYPPLTSAAACAVLLGDCGDVESVHGWTLDVPEGKPPVEVPTMPEAGLPTTRVLQLTDIHLDLSYTLGTASKDCGQEVLCCTNTSIPATSPDNEAGYWGDYQCDVPIWTFSDLLLQIKFQHPDIDYILLTGDYPAHDIWTQSKSANLEHSRTAIEAVRSAFPDTPVYPAMGNHESFPCNSYPPSSVVGDFAIGWLYESLADYMDTWLSPEARETFVQDGHYSVQVFPGFRIVAINSNVCLGYNFWSLYNTVDPSNQLSWLTQELLKAELAGERVHILSHVPTSDSDCGGGWGREYAKIISRFENTVTGQFYGHTHLDEFVMFYDTETNSRATNMGFVSPSVSTYTDLNPAYRIFTLDGPYEGASMRVIDVDTYSVDLKSANSLGSSDSPSYTKLYNHRETLPLDTLFPESFDAFVRQMATDEELYEQFHSLVVRNSDRREDKRSLLCFLVSPSSLDHEKCEEYFGK